MDAAASETTALLIFLHNLVFRGYTAIYLLYSNKGWKAEITEKARSHLISIFLILFLILHDTHKILHLIICASFELTGQPYSLKEIN